MGSRPDKAFRIADGRHPIFDGTGAFLVGARWNSAGRRIIYAADSFASAMLELLVHANVGRVPSSHRWIEISIPVSVSLEWPDASSIGQWNVADSATARTFGDEWFDQRRSLILIVPSAVTNGMTNNLLINQDHPEFAQLTTTTPRKLSWDARLFSR